MRADRLLALLLLLQNRGRLTAATLAAELEVSVRTVYRDVEALGAAGVPVVTERGPAGGYRLLEGYRTRLTGLTDAEAGSLFLAGAPGPARDLGLGAALTAAQLKLQAALPEQAAARARRIQDRFHLDAPAWFREAEQVPWLGDLARAVWEQQVVRCHYRRWGGEVRRELRALGLVLKSGIWYLVALAEPQPQPEAVAEGAGPEGAEGSEAGTNEADGVGAADGGERRGPRTYRVSRFLAVEQTGRSFERPADFELAAYWTAAADRLTAMLHQGTAELRLSPRAAQLLPARFGAVGARALARAQAPGPDGWIRLTLPVESPAVAVGDLLHFGSEAEVVGPPELRAALAAEVAALAARYLP
ncbi:WYL domain-containing protein [Kitasatospora sp. NBC_01250]|uniref:helix-turn-helix transcriptional regulator n=1 Tax=Kitasatospora sp. NBC_01250 TaxID=2903571 RepID=UPI002E357263|nr:WYL domain-containing protein [Kitasatospora sp. NBC_01250]